MDATGAEETATWREIGALFLLPFGGLALPVFGWFLGVLLLWYSDAWTRRDKLIGTLVVPGGLLAPAFLFAVVAANGAPLWPFVLLALLALAPLAADGYLVWRLRGGVRAY